MQSANSLLNNPDSTPNVLSSNILNVPDSRVLGENNNISKIRNLKFKDRYYIDNRMDQQMKNNDGLSLGANNKFLKSRDYDRQIDTNYLRRQDPNNKKYTQPDDFYNGSALAYFEIPKTIPRAVIPDPLAGGAIDATNKYQYKNRFISNTSIDPRKMVPTPKPDTKPDDTKPDDTKKPMEKNNTKKPMGKNNTKDMDDIMKQIENERKQTITRREFDKADKKPNSIKLDKGKDKYGNAAIRTPTKFNNLKDINMIKNVGPL